MAALDFAIQGRVLRVQSQGLDALTGMFGAAPDATVFHIRNLFGRWLGYHRRTWLGGIDKKMNALGRRGVFYANYPGPEARTMSQTRAATKGKALSSIGSRLIVHPGPAAIQETGGTIKPTKGRYLAMPLGKYQRMTKKKLRAELGGTSPSTVKFDLSPGSRKKAGGRQVVLFRQLEAKTKGGKHKRQAVFLLKRSVTLKPRLGVLAAWDSQGSARKSRLDQTVTALHAEIGKEFDKRVAKVTSVLKRVG
jgi:hypothetical protein